MTDTNRSAETYALGEVAIFHRPDSQFFGVEVTITGPLEPRSVHDYRDGSLVTEPCYMINGPFDNLPMKFPRNGKWTALPEHLRKRPPPKDWVTICQLESAPEETRLEEFA